MAKPHKKTWTDLVQRQQELEREHTALAMQKLSVLGLIGQPQLTVNGQVSYHVGPEHIALMCEILAHPEKWPESWDENRRAQFTRLRNEAIAKGMIQP